MLGKQQPKPSQHMGLPAAGIGLAALLTAKRALLHYQRCPSGSSSGGSGSGGSGSGGVEVLPLLELAVGGTPAITSPYLHQPLGAIDLRDVQASCACCACCAAGAAYGTRRAWPAACAASHLQRANPACELTVSIPCMLSTLFVLPSLACTARQIQWELAADSNVFSDGTSDGMLIHLPPSSSGSGGGDLDAPPPQPSLLFSMLAQPPGAGCPLCPPPQEPAQECYWPPETPAEALWALGPVGLGQLQALDLSGASGMDELTELVASQCSALQRLRLPGCSSMSDGCLSWLSQELPGLRELDVSGGWLKGCKAPLPLLRCNAM
jgi:hypothetical protein